MANPPTKQVLLSVTLDPATRSGAVARKALRAVLEVCPGAPTDAVLLITTELVNNAVEHAKTPCRLDLTVEEQILTLAVTDSRPDAVPHVRTPSSGAFLKAGGRGLLLVESFTQSWGYTVDDLTKTTWARISCNGTSDQVLSETPLRSRLVGDVDHFQA